MAATWSEHDQHDDQILPAAHEVLGLMRASDAQVAVIDRFRKSREHGNEHVERRTVSVDERGIVISANMTIWWGGMFQQAWIDQQRTRETSAGRRFLSP